ncbi:MAG: Cna B-type domain-containing protein [Clostridia bacterium]|nr:Cna B-type domain-containing protein [Clostridia bacterium]
MKSRLQRILSVLCVLAMLASCMAVTAFAEEADPVSRAIVVEWNDQDNYDGLRPAYVNAFIDGETVRLSEENSWTAVRTVRPDSEWHIEEEFEGYESKIVGNEVVTVTYTHVPATTSFTATIVWEDNDNALGLRPETIRLLLLADGEVCRTPVDAKDGASWTDLPLNKKGTNEPIFYSVVPADRLDTYYAMSDGKSIVTCTLKTADLTLAVATTGSPQNADLSGLTVTVTGPDPRMPMTFTLDQLINGAGSIGAVIPGTYVAQENNASTLIEGYVIDPENSKVGDAVYLKAGDAGILQIKYAWKEAEAAPKNEDPMAETGALSFEILGPDARLPMTVTYAQFTDGKYELDNLVPGSYAVIETNAEGLITAYNLASDSVTGMVLTVGKDGATASLFNRYTPAPKPDEPIDIPVTKIWVDDNNKDGNRPGSITVTLYANGVATRSMEITAPAWTGTFTGLPQLDEEDKEIVYTVNEEPVAWYVASVDGYTITNTYQPEVTATSVTKVWMGDQQNLNMRPTALAVTLLPTKQVYVLNAENNWTVVANNLPTRLNGEEVTYSWKEEKVGGYTMATETAGAVTTITNTYVPIPPAANHKGKTGGDNWAIFDEYDTPLGGQLLINHVGDCFD